MPSSFNYAANGLMAQIVGDIKNIENDRRKRVSFTQSEILRDILLPSVENYLRAFFKEDTIKQMPVFGSINLCRRIIKNEASVYATQPERTFEGVSEDQAEALKDLYQAMGVDQKMKKANEYFKLQEQTHIYVVPVAGALKLKACMLHHLDVVPSPEDPEQADAYILNGYDRSLYIPRYGEVGGTQSDGINQKIADPDDYKQNLQRFVLWSDDQNIVCDKSGNILSQDTENPIGIKPFVEIVSEKDNEYFTRGGTAVTDFTIQWNASISDLAHIVRMQGFAQAWFKGHQDSIPENIQIGPNFVIKLPINPDQQVETDFGFANANPDLDGSIRFIEMILSAFLTSRGIDPKLVNTKGESGQSFSSGLERLLSMIDMFAPAKADFEIFKRAELKLFEIIKTYVNTYQGTDILKMNIGAIPETATMSIKFHQPEMVQTESEQLSNIQAKRELGLMSRKQAVKKLYEVSDEQAEKIIQEIDEEELTQTQEPEVEQPNQGNEDA